MPADLEEMKRQIRAMSPEERRDVKLFLYEVATESEDWREEMGRRLTDYRNGAGIPLDSVRPEILANGREV